MRFVALALPLLSFAVVAALPAAEPAPRFVPTPRAALLPLSAVNRPFLAAAQAQQPVNLAAAGFIEQEYTVSGLANIYEWGATPADPVTVRTPAVPYTTRLLLRRPVDPKKFSGRVIVELLNPTALYDIAPLWGLSYTHFMQRGDVWVGVTVKPVAAATLQRFDPVRYAALSFAHAQPAECQPAAGTAGAPGMEDGRANPRDAENGLAWDITAQVGALLRSSSKENPLLQFEPRQLIAAGYSQTGGYIVTYANALHAQSRLGDGNPVYDGFMNAAGRQGTTAINQCAALLPEGDPRRVVMPLDVPFVTVMTQTDFYRQPAVRRDDSDERGSEYRLYEVTGSAHSGPAFPGQPTAADLSIAGFTTREESACGEPRSDFPLGLAMNAIWQQFHERLATGTPMSREPRIDVAGDGPALDATGNATGGLRLPQIDVPLAQYRGQSTPRSSDAAAAFGCSLTGAMQPFDAPRLKELYRDRNAYLRRFQEALDAAVQSRRLTAEDAAALRSSIVKSVPAF